MEGDGQGIRRLTEPQEDRSLPPGQLYNLGWVFYLLLAVAGVIWVGLREGRIPLSLFARADDWWIDTARGLVAALGLLLLWEGGSRLWPMARALEDWLRRAIGTIEPSQAMGLAVLSGFSEEFFFRGAVQGSWGFLPAAILFALLHTSREKSFYLWTAFAGIAGLVFGGLTLWTENLLAATIAHTVFNAWSFHRLSLRS